MQILSSLTPDLVGIEYQPNGGCTMSRKLPARSEKATLSETVDHRVKLYSIAAAAAGVSMLALAQPAEGEVLITKQTIPIFGLVYLDINHDGVNDFEFYSYFS